jgi:hypothetical protein
MQPLHLNNHKSILATTFFSGSFLRLSIWWCNQNGDDPSNLAITNKYENFAKHPYNFQLPT